MQYYTTRTDFFLSSIIIALLDFPFILIIYSIHYVVVKIFIDIALVAVSLLFRKKTHAIIFLSAFMLFEIFGIMSIAFDDILDYFPISILYCIPIGFSIAPKLVGFKIAYKKNAGKSSL